MTPPTVKFGTTTQDICTKRAGYRKFDPSSYGECVRTERITVPTATICVPTQDAGESCVALPPETAKTLFDQYQRLLNGAEKEPVRGYQGRSYYGGPKSTFPCF
ncbi:MAG: hypothetical protein HY696_03080 [Deltaproteobacteria bacterium]|nr:hypothetical protein [Deltaproteobacteria bacterium]